MLSAIAIVAIILAALLLLSGAMYLWLPDIDKTGDLARITQASVTAIIVAVGAMFAAVKFQIFRESAPHVTVTQTVTHRRIGDSYVHLMVTATLYNSSKVKMDFRRGYFRFQQISPITDSEVENLYADVFVDGKHRDFQWELLKTVERNWEINDIIIEPGESHQETCEFIVIAEVETVLIDTFFYNPRQPAIPQGWGTTSVYDILSDSR